MAGAALLAFVAFIFFALVIAAVAIRGRAPAQDVAMLAGFAPYAIALALVHGLVAHFAMSANQLAQSIAFIFAVIGTVMATAATIAVAAGFDPIARTGSSGTSWAGVGILVMVAAVYAAAAYLLRSSDSGTSDR